MNKTDITKDTRREAKERLIRLQDRMRDLIMQNKGQHTINQIAYSYDSIP